MVLPRHLLDPEAHAQNLDRLADGLRGELAEGLAGVRQEAATALAAGLAQSSGVPSGCVVLWSGAIADIPAGWALCDGSRGTPDLRGRFVVGAQGAGTYVPGAVGGSDKTGATTLSVAQMPSHGHSLPINVSGSASSPKGPGSTGGSGYLATNAAGGSQAHDHDLIPPYYALCYIMKL